MNYTKITLNKIIITLCMSIIIQAHSAETDYSAHVNAKERRQLVTWSLTHQNNRTQSEINELYLRQAVLDKNITQVQQLLNKYNKSYMPLKIVDDAQASIDETSYDSCTKLAKRKIIGGLSLLGISLVGGAVAALSGEKKDRGMLCLSLIGGTFSGLYILGVGISDYSYDSDTYSEFYEKYPDEQKRATAIECAQQIKTLIDNYRSKQH